ncbi:MAG TPA: hypothetical protein ENK05_00705 [Gammaproteobacteria bacterium]|nr:hypothetical protein [Gammaproteobacteria bacterium]
MKAQQADRSARATAARAEYQLGLNFFRRKQWKTAARHFGLAEQKAGRHDIHRNLYMSYHGLSLLYSGDVSGLNLCRHAAAHETIEATVCQNLVLAEIRFHHRKRACDAIALGLGIDPAHRGLLKLRRKLGVRRRPCIPFLRRENLLNKWLGKATYRPARMHSR